MHRMWCFPMLGEREKSFPKIPLINKDYQGFDLQINIILYGGFILSKKHNYITGSKFYVIYVPF